MRREFHGLGVSVFAEFLAIQISSKQHTNWPTRSCPLGALPEMRRKASNLHSACPELDRAWGCLALETSLACHWEGVRLPQTFWKLHGLYRIHRSSPEVPWRLRAIQRFPRSSQHFPRVSPDPLQKQPDLDRGQFLSLSRMLDTLQRLTNSLSLSDCQQANQDQTANGMLWHLVLFRFEIGYFDLNLLLLLPSEVVQHPEFWEPFMFVIALGECLAVLCLQAFGCILCLSLQDYEESLSSS